jgi:hypothetical protein
MQYNDPVLSLQLLERKEIGLDDIEREIGLNNKA